LRELGITPSKALGQHFLHDRKVVKRIVDESGVDNSSVVLEIGPGLGILTSELTKRVQRVVAVERDPRLAEALRSVDLKKLEVVEADALDVDFSDLMGNGQFHVVANLPYSVGSAIIQRLQEAKSPPQTLTLMVQREVAERIVARPPDMNLLAVGVQFHGKPKLLFRVGAGAFVPPPNVQSAVVHIQTHPEPPLPAHEREIYFRIVRAGFAHPRKQLVNNLMSGLGYDRVMASQILDSAGIEPTVRPERLTVDDWLRLYRATTAGDP
jgi:16S rRNA (adenine1518-N6/adenine1519-N6)-dimethyltransferase